LANKLAHLIDENLPHFNTEGSRTSYEWFDKLTILSEAEGLN